MSAVWIEPEETATAPLGQPLPKDLKIDREDMKLEKRLCREVGRAIVDFNMIEEGDKVMVCVSGGKDSYAMLDILLKLQQRAPINFSLIAVNLDQKQPGFPAHILPDYLSKLGVPFHIETQDTYSIVKRVILPGAAPQIAETLRLVLGWAWTYVIVAELVGSSSGIGHMIMDSQRLLDTGQMIFGILCIGVIGLVSDLLFKWLNQRMYPWAF